MKILVFWDNDKHFGTCTVSDKYLIIPCDKRKNIVFEAQYVFENDEMYVNDDTRSIIKTPAHIYDFEELIQEEFNKKYPKNEFGYHQYN